MATVHRNALRTSGSDPKKPADEMKQQHSASNALIARGSPSLSPDPLAPSTLRAVEPFPGAAAVLQGEYFAAVKGAPQYVVDQCTRVLGPDGVVVPMDPNQRQSLLAVVDDLSAQALRVLAIGYTPFDTVPYEKEKEQADGTAASPSASSAQSGAGRPLGESGDDVSAKLTICTKGMVFVGFVASIDPPRDGIKEALETADHAGIKTIMITGEQRDEAQPSRLPSSRRCRYADAPAPVRLLTLVLLLCLFFACR